MKGTIHKTSDEEGEDVEAVWEAAGWTEGCEGWVGGERERDGEIEGEDEYAERYAERE